MHSHRMHAPCQAHESAVWSLAWHPLGHLLASGSNDHAIKFWCRSRPGDGKKRAREDEDKEEEARAAGTTEERKEEWGIVALWLPRRFGSVFDEAV